MAWTTKAFASEAAKRALVPSATECHRVPPSATECHRAHRAVVPWYRARPGPGISKVEGGRGAAPSSVPEGRSLALLLLTPTCAARQKKPSHMLDLDTLAFSRGGSLSLSQFLQLGCSRPEAATTWPITSASCPLALSECRRRRSGAASLGLWVRFAGLRGGPRQAFQAPRCEPGRLDSSVPQLACYGLVFAL